MAKFCCHWPLLEVYVQCKTVNICTLYRSFVSSSIVSGGIIVFLCFILYDVTGAVLHRKWALLEKRIINLVPGHISLFKYPTNIFFLVRKREEFNKSCNLIGSGSGRNFLIRPAHGGRNRHVELRFVNKLTVIVYLLPFLRTISKTSARVPSGLQTEKTFETTRPQADWFYCFRAFGNLMKPEARVFEISSPTKKINRNYHFNKFSKFKYFIWDEECEPVTYLMLAGLWYYFICIQCHIVT